MSPLADHSRFLDLLASLVDEPDPARRGRRLLGAARELTGALTAGLLHEHGGRWHLAGSTGEGAPLPDADQVAAVADGVLDPLLPEGRVVIVGGEAGARRALVLAGLPPEDAEREERLDWLEAVLAGEALIGAGDAPSLSDRVLPPFTGQGSYGLLGGVHGVRPPQAASELRALLQSIRANQERLEHAPLDRTEREGTAAELERQCLRAADLWLGGVPAPGSLRALLAELGHEDIEFDGRCAREAAVRALAVAPEASRELRALLSALLGYVHPGCRLRVDWAPRGGRAGLHLMAHLSELPEELPSARARALGAELQVHHAGRRASFGLWLPARPPEARRNAG